MLSADGEIWTWGCGDNGRLGNGETTGLELPEPLEFFDKINCTAISAGGGFTLALCDDGQLYGWGMNNSKLRLITSHNVLLIVECNILQMLKLAL